jgi:hypothetical protein
MPRVTHVKKARKDNPVCKKGESYYWWKFRYGGKRYSLTRPRPSQLTQSAYFGTLYSMQEEIEDWSGETYDDFESLKEDITSQIDDLRSETQDSLDNMPDQLQYSPTGELLQERVDALDSAESELDCIDEFDEEEPEEDDFDNECPDCDGTGDNPDYDEDDEDDDAEEEECATCSGTGEGVFDGDEFEQAKQNYADAFDNWLTDAKSALTEALDSAIV